MIPAKGAPGRQLCMRSDTSSTLENRPFFTGDAQEPARRAIVMTAGARSYDDLKRTADELWVDDGNGPADPTQMAPNASAAHVTCTKAGRYDAGAVISGRYELIEVLGEGGMGSVWVAKNRTLDVEVALKLMRADLTDDVQGIASRMLQEARAAACIGHPAIIQVFDFGFAEQGDPFIVMELLRGESLAQALRRRRRVSPARAAQTLLPIIDALAAAHAHGIVHRDLKPENIFLARPAGQRLQPKVLDFGIAKLEQRAAERLTRDGAVIGSPAYMSPEQFCGDGSIDGRADIWALCVVLYEMITGHRPFEGDGYQGAVFWNVLNAKPRAIAEYQIDEPALWGILEKGLEKEPSGRHQDMRRFGSALADWLMARGIQQDICDASLRAWINPVDAAMQRDHSFFPSREPSAQAQQQIVVDPLSQAIRDAVESSGTRPVERAGRRSSSAHLVRSERRLLWLATLGALVAFMGTAGLAAWSASSRPNEVSEPAPEHRPQPVSLPTSPATRALERPQSIEPVPVEPRPPATSPRVPAPRARRARTPAHPGKPAQELKDPFG
jgi:eukaryotic-like serine/threonine-protein kinase